MREIVEVPVVSEALRRLGAPVAAAVRAGGLVFTCGMPPIDPVTGALVTGSIEDQARAALAALRVTLEQAGASLDGVVKANVYLTDPALMAGFNAVYREVFAGNAWPARTLAAIRPWPLPFDVEIECVAVAGG
jgi:2-iminobutanoate/2-iminopropanoate deaminase